MNEEPREIADKMLQAGLISVAQHDDVADVSTKYQRLEKLFEILKSKLSCSTFVDMVIYFEQKTGLTPAFKCKSFFFVILIYIKIDAIYLFF